jgi:hypothetical protein
VPFIRHTRDKRGYETTYVMHQYRPVQGPQRTRVLYLFRSPSHVKIGRQPLDEEIREALEHTHPDVSFDWMSLSRESTVVRSDELRDRGPRGQRPSRPAPSAPVQPAIAEDHSLLGRVAGADRAARLRAAHADLLQRIGRRSRTPEERDRLTERMQRLNPDDWPDEATVRAQLETVQAEWTAIASELPARRRGRRGGRNRDRAESAEAASPVDGDRLEPGDGEIDDESAGGEPAESASAEPVASTGIMTVEVQGERETDQGTQGPGDEGTKGPGDQGTRAVDPLRPNRAAAPRGGDDDRGGAGEVVEPAGDDLPRHD